MTEHAKWFWRMTPENRWDATSAIRFEGMGCLTTKATKPWFLTRYQANFVKKLRAAAKKKLETDNA